jgi:hypothetical protein
MLTLFHFLLINFFTEFLHFPPLHIGSETANPRCESAPKLGTFGRSILGDPPKSPKLPKIKGELKIEKHFQWITLGLMQNDPTHYQTHMGMHQGAP